MSQDKELIYPLTFAEHYYISSLGMVYFYKQNEKRIILVPHLVNDKLTIIIHKKEYFLLDLMLKYFFYNVKDYTSMQVKLKKKNPTKIPISAITFNNENVLPNHSYISYKFNVNQKVTNANTRAIDMITEYDVVIALQKCNFQCRYCGNKLKSNNWHLEHIKALAKGGKNIRENLTGACKMCNTMKHAFDEREFLLKCEKIYINNKEKIDEMKEYNLKVSKTN
jgi:5-methylcytosine-specific restriction endonuclease McrA